DLIFSIAKRDVTLLRATSREFLVELVVAGESVMCVVGLRQPYRRQPTILPVAAARHFIGHERWKTDRRHTLPVAIGIAIVGNLRIGAAPGSRQNEEPSMPFDKMLSFEFPMSRLPRRCGDRRRSSPFGR